jgi:hypothetical protein
MASARPDRVGVLVVRVWIESDPESELRARITQTLDIANGEDRVTTASSIEEIDATVRAWLEEFVAG